VDWFILRNHLFGFKMVLQRTFKHVEWTIVPVLQCVLNVFFQCDLKLPPRVTLSNFEQRIAESLNKFLKKRLALIASLTYIYLPFSVCFPCISHTSNDDWFVADFIFFNELFNTEVINMYSFNSVFDLRHIVLGQNIFLEEVAIS
jgi:hypothetical protein